MCLSVSQSVSHVFGGGGGGGLSSPRSLPSPSCLPSPSLGERERWTYGEYAGKERKRNGTERRRHRQTDRQAWTGQDHDALALHTIVPPPHPPPLHFDFVTPNPDFFPFFVIRYLGRMSKAGEF